MNHVHPCFIVPYTNNVHIRQGTTSLFEHINEFSQSLLNVASQLKMGSPLMVGPQFESQVATVMMISVSEFNCLVDLKGESSLLGPHCSQRIYAMDDPLDGNR